MSLTPKHPYLIYSSDDPRIKCIQLLMIKLRITNQHIKILKKKIQYTNKSSVEY